MDIPGSAPFSWGLNCPKGWSHPAPLGTGGNCRPPGTNIGCGGGIAVIGGAPLWPGMGTGVGCTVVTISYGCVPCSAAPFNRFRLPAREPAGGSSLSPYASGPLNDSNPRFLEAGAPSPGFPPRVAWAGRPLAKGGTAAVGGGRAPGIYDLYATTAKRSLTKAAESATVDGTQVSLETTMCLSLREQGVAMSLPTIFEKVGHLGLAQLSDLVFGAIVAKEGENIVGENVGVGIGARDAVARGTKAVSHPSRNTDNPTSPHLLASSSRERRACWESRLTCWTSGAALRSTPLARPPRRP